MSGYRKRSDFVAIYTQLALSNTSSVYAPCLPSQMLVEEIQDPEDILSSSLGTLYGYTPVTLSSAGATLVYTHQKGLSYSQLMKNDDGHVMGKDDNSYSEPLKVTIQTPDTHARNWALHASSVWMSAVFLADHIEELNLQGFLDRRPRSHIIADQIQLLELGAGAGLPGLVSAKYLQKLSSETGLWNVTLSDYPDDTLIGTLKMNVTQNNLNYKQCRVVPYAWGEDTHPLLIERSDSSLGYDIIIASDTLWNRQFHSPFIDTILQVSRKSDEARIHLIAGFHTGRYVIGAFLNAISSQYDDRRAEGLRALEVESIQEHSVLSNTALSSSRSWDLDREEGEDERRKWVVWIVLKWS